MFKRRNEIVAVLGFFLLLAHFAGVTSQQHADGSNFSSRSRAWEKEAKHAPGCDMKKFNESWFGAEAKKRA